MPENAIHIEPGNLLLKFSKRFLDSGKKLTIIFINLFRIHIECSSRQEKLNIYNIRRHSTTMWAFLTTH